MGNNFILLLIVFIFKINIFIGLPLTIILIKKDVNRIIYFEYVFISLFIIFRLLNVDLVTNSTISGLRRAYRGYQYNHYVLSDFYNKYEDVDIDKVETNQFYKNSNDDNVFYYNNNTSPLNNKIVSFGSYSSYFKYYGNGMTAVSSILSTIFYRDIDPIELLNLSIDNNIISYENGVDINNLLNVVSGRYNVSVSDISLGGIGYYLNRGKILLAEVKYVDGFEKNIVCNKGYVVIYRVDKDDNYYILNPNYNVSNNTIDEYICPDNTPGGLTIIKNDNNERPWSITELSQIVTHIYYIERNDL